MSFLLVGVLASVVSGEVITKDFNMKFSTYQKCDVAKEQILNSHFSGFAQAEGYLECVETSGSRLFDKPMMPYFDRDRIERFRQKLLNDPNMEKPQKSRSYREMREQEPALEPERSKGQDRHSEVWKRLNKTLEDKDLSNEYQKTPKPFVYGENLEKCEK